MTEVDRLAWRREALGTYVAGGRSTSGKRGWNFADTWERNTDRFPDAFAQHQGARSFTWREFDCRADGIAACLLSGGVAAQAKVAQYLYNCPEYLESVFGSFKAGLVPVNTNFRYSDDELVYLWDNADAAAVIFHGSFTERCDRIRGRVPGVRLWIHVDDATSACPDWAVPYEKAAASADGRVTPQWGRSPDDLYLLYTGGTTGSPKGVMWRQDDLLRSLDAASREPLPTSPGWSEFDTRVPEPGPRSLAAAPLMHGTGALNAMWNLVLAGSVVTLEGRRFDPIELLDAIHSRHVKSVSLVGDAFSKPILAALDAEPKRWDISSLRLIISSGAIWTEETKQGLLRHNNRLILVDALGSSEAIGMATNTTTAGGDTRTAQFRLGPNTKVLTEDGTEVRPGSGELGRVALRGPMPIGYYKDPAKSAQTFIGFGNARWSIPGDWAEVEADGSLRLHGRGSQCINSGGEKVFPEEVEETLKTHHDVSDAAVVGVPNERLGEAIAALVQLAPHANVDEAQLVEHVRTRLAAFKSPRHVIIVESIDRGPHGKLDYRELRARAIESLGLITPAVP